MADKQKPSRFEKNRLFVLNDPLSPRLSPALAVEMGLNESLLFLQIEFLLVVEGVWIGDRKWVRKSLTDWTAIFSFISTQTVNRAIEQLKKDEYIYVENFDKGNHKAPRWFAINVEGASKLKSITLLKPLSQNETEPPQEDKSTPSQNETESPQEDKATPSQNETALSQNEKAPSQFETEPSQNETALSQNETESSQNEIDMNKEKERGRERKSRERHTQEKKGVSNLSKFPRPQIRQWVEWRLARGGPKCDPYVVSLARVKDGQADDEIQRDWPQVKVWLAEQSPPTNAGNEISLPGEADAEFRQHFLAQVQQRVNPKPFQDYFAGLQINRGEGVVYLSLPTIVVRDRRLPEKEVRDWMMSRYSEILEEVLSDLELSQYGFEFVIG